MKSGQGFNQSGGDRTRPPADPRTLEEIQRRSPQVAGRVEITRMPAGTIITPAKAIPRRDFVLPYHPLVFRQNGANTNAVVKPGLVVVRHIEEGLADGLNSYEPNIAGVSMWSSPRPELRLAGNVSYNYLTCNTNELGRPDSNGWKFISVPAEVNSVHHIPPDPEGVNGTNGSYFIECFRTNIGNSPEVELGWGGHFIWTADMWAGVHPGAGGYTSADSGRPYSRYDEDANRHNFRIHLRGHGHNVTETTDTIPHRFYGRNIGTGSSNIANVYTGNTSKSAAEFNIIKERDSDPQVKVIQSDNESPIEIRGNGNDLNVHFKNCAGSTVFSLTFIDGLVQQSGTQNIDLGDCSGT